MSVEETHRLCDTIHWQGFWYLFAELKMHAKRIVLVRHGESTRNALRFDGRFVADDEELKKPGARADHLVELTDLGRRQASALGRALSECDHDFTTCDAWFDSGYLRACETLDLILDGLGMNRNAGGKRQSHLELRERDFGYAFNMTRAQVGQYFPWYFQYQKEIGKFHERPPGGESLADLFTRVHMFLNSIRRFRDGQNVFIVSHSRVMLAFRYWLEKYQAKDIDELFAEEKRRPEGVTSNCEIHIYDRDHKLRKFVRQKELEEIITTHYNVYVN